MDANEQVDKYCITFDLIKKSLNELNNKSIQNINIDKIIEFSKKFEYLYNILFVKKQNSFLLFERNFLYFQKYSINKDIKLKKNKYINNNPESALLSLIIPSLKIFINKKKHKNIKKIFLVLIKFFISQILPYEVFKIIIELILSTLTNLLKLNNGYIYHVDDEPFNIINDIIISLISYPEEIKIENSDTYILADIIELFDKYLITQKNPNIILGETYIWLKLLENHVYIPFIQNEISLGQDNISIEHKLELQKKLFSFLIKIYKLSIRNDHMENIIIKNSILDLNYYLNSLNFLKQLFLSEIKSMPLYNFKIKDGIIIPKNKYVFFDKIKSKNKTSEISIIFSFKIFQKEFDKIIDILEIYDYKKRSILKLYFNKKGFLSLEQTENNKVETSISIQEDYCYFLCLSYNNYTFNSKIYLNLNGDEKSYEKKINTLDFSKEFSLVLGKNNFFGVIGELLIINKSINTKKVNHLFELNEDYANILKKISYNFKMFPQRIKLKYKIDYNNSEKIQKSKEFFKQLKFDIIFEISSKDVLYSSSKIMYIPEININYTNGNDNNNGISNIKNNSFSLVKKNKGLFTQIYEMIYSYDMFYHSNGIDFLTFQLYNIFSKITDIQTLNLYLHETLSFIMNLFAYHEKNYAKKEEKPKLESELIIFFITLLNLLKNNKGKFYLNNNVILQLIDFYEYFNINRLINERNMILSILLDIDYYKNKEDIFKYQKLLEKIKNELKEKSNDNKYIINKEFLYKLLNLDFCLETKEFNHKFFIELITGFISFEKKSKTDDPKLIELIHNEFITYVLKLKNELKIYHYLKIIYFNINDIKNSLNFNQDIIKNMEKINYKHCKYCAYNQILYFLINYEAIINLTGDKDKIFQHSPSGFMVNPSFLFLKCFYSQLFNLSNQNRIKFIKMKSDPIDFIFTLINHEKEVFNYDKFKEKFGNIINYLQFLIQQMNFNDANYLEKILYSFKFIINFLKRIVKYEIDIIKDNEKTDNTKQKKEIPVEKKENNLQNLLSNEDLTNFFDIYLNINYNQAFEELKYFINISHAKVVFPFYFYLIFKKYEFNVDNDINNNNKFELFKYIVNKFNNNKINFDINKDAIIIQNFIAFLICIYNLVINSDEEINPELEKEIFLFLNYLKDNNFFNCKYAFDVNLKLEKENKHYTKEKKFILEIVCDIYFHLYKKNKFSIVYQNLIIELFMKEKILELDNQYFLDEKHKAKEYIFYNKNFLGNVAGGEEKQDIIFSVYFLKYLLKRLNKYKIVSKIYSNEFNDPTNFIMENMQMLLDNTFVLINQNSKRINHLIKIFQKENKYNSYTNLFDYIKMNYKSKNFTLNRLVEHYNKLIPKKEIKFKRKGKRKNSEGNTNQNNYLGIKKNLKNNDSNKNKIYVEQQNINNSKLSFEIINFEKRVNKSISHLSFRKIIFTKKYGFKQISTQNDSEEKKLNDKNEIYKKLQKIKRKMTLNQINIQSNTISISDHSEKKTDNIITKSPKANSISSEKLKDMNIPFLYYKIFFRTSDSNVMRQLFNPKDYYIWNKFNNVLKNVIFSQKKFIHLSNLFKLKFRKKNILKSSVLKNRDFSLKHPIKLKNFICDDYYRPFTKPDLNFFNNKSIDITHHYLKSKFLSANKFYIDKINKIRFTPMIPNTKEESSNSKIVCELINEKGSYFGELYLNHAFLLFVSSFEKDPRKPKKSKNYDNIKDELFYLYSFFLYDRVTDKNKNIIIFNSEIKEVVIRRFCFNYIGYEIFLKNNKSYLFNFFNKDNSRTFLECLITKIEENKKRDENFNKLQSLNLSDVGISSSYHVNINEEINFDIVLEPIKYLEEKDFCNKYYKGELTNFKFLLLLNKYAARSYHDLYQYLIFPLLFMDASRKTERDLSKPIPLNKNPEKYNDLIEEIKNNFKHFGSHFNSNYSTSGFVLYYLVRMNPFTAMHLKLQSNQFDAPKRMFFTFEDFLKAVKYSQESRELTPEFFHNYEIFLNLNYLNLGFIDEQNLIINDLDTGDKNGIAEFIINMRKQLEKVNILPWINNVFGCNQDVKNNHNHIYNAYPTSAYEKNNNYELKKHNMKKEGKKSSEIINAIKDDLNLLNFGMIPIQLFKTALKKKKNSKHISIKKEINTRPINKNYPESNLLNDIKNIFKSYLKENSKLFLLDNNYGQKLVIQSKRNVYAFPLLNQENQNNIINIELWHKKQMKLLPLSNMICELSQEVYLSCRYLDKIIQLNYSDKNKFLFYHENIVTAVKFLSHTQKTSTKNIINHSSKVIFGDEIGYLNLMKIDYKINTNNQMELDKIKILKNIKVHNSIIQGILFVKRLNIIISYSQEGQIAINNAFDLNVLNIIELGNEFYIKEIKISKYDLIYIYCTNKENEKFNYIKCYSLNGIKFTELITEKKIINFFIAENLLVAYENNLIETFNLYEMDGEPLFRFNLNKRNDVINELEDKADNELNEELEKNENKKIINCLLNKLEKNLIIIYEDKSVFVEDLFDIL